MPIYIIAHTALIYMVRMRYIKSAVIMLYRIYTVLAGSPVMLCKPHTGHFLSSFFPVLKTAYLITLYSVHRMPTHSYGSYVLHLTSFYTCFLDMSITSSSKYPVSFCRDKMGAPKPMRFYRRRGDPSTPCKNLHTYQLLNKKAVDVISYPRLPYFY